MGVIKTKLRSVQRRIRPVFVCAVAFVIGVLVLVRPAVEVKAIVDPGLDSGNAVVDRTSVPGQTILKYQTTGTSTFKAPAGVTSVRVLVVGGGGGGGAAELAAAGDGGGGGGAGEYTHVASQTVVPGQTVAITVGGGGAGSTTKQNDGGTTAQNGTSGGNSVFGSLTARGGGGGGGNDQHGLNGGSGGGAGGHCTSGVTNGGTKTAVAPGVGNNGGNSPSGSCTPRGAAGGGGAGAVGTNGSGGGGGIGGAGTQTDITGANAFYAAGGGGGGGANSGTGANGGSSIGGKGGNAGATGGNGVVGAANTGSGGGGGGATSSSSGGNGGNGGTGTVIVRFTTQDIPAPTGPGGVTGLTMWYKADGADNTNALWKDSSGFGYNMTQGTVSKQPVLTTNVINFNPAYVFDGADDVFRMDSQGIGTTQPMTAFFGANLTRTDGGWRFFNEFGDDRPSLGFDNGNPELYVEGTNPVKNTYGTTAANTPHVFTYVSPNADGQSRIVGVDDNEKPQDVTSGRYGTGTVFTGTSFGSTNGSSGTSFSGPIAEGLYFNKVLTPAEKLKIISYLAIKYGVTRYQGASGAGYVDSAATTIWPADSTFKNNIAGIGRDDASVLNQKQSKSSAAGDIVTIGHEAIAATNQANPNNFGLDRAFLLWGHNSAATNTNTTVTGGYIRMDRVWKAVRTTSMGAIKVRIPKSAVTQGGNGVMFISTSTTFDASTQRVAMTDLGTEYEATVSALPAATSYFSFGSLTGSDIQFVSKTAKNIGGDTITSYTPGESMQYILEVKNNGPDNAGIVTVTDTLPAGLVPVSATGGGWNCPAPAGQTITCTRAALNSGVTAPTISVEVDIASSVTGTKANTASASVANDPDTTNNSASLALAAGPKADLSITKSHTGTPTAGNPHTYKFSVTNNGPSDVASFTITDPLNSKMSLVSSTNGVACAPVGLPDGQTITCTGGALTANGVGSTVNFDMVVNVAADYGGGTISNTGTVAVPAGTTDPNSTNNSSTDQSNILVDTQVGVAKTHTGNFTAGVNNTFTIAVDNQGPSTSPIGSITVTDTLDEDFELVSAVGADWTCSPPGSTTVTCTNNVAMTAGTTSNITLTVLVDSIAKGSTTNTAEVTTTTPDTDLTDNSSTDNVTIVSTADLGITKAHVGLAFTAGAQEQYNLSVVNNGPSADAPSYTITDTLPGGMTLAGFTGAASCTGTATITCTGGAIGVGDPAQVTTITVNVPPSASGTINNTATVAPAAGVTDPVAANNNSTDNVNVEPNADLSITKSHTGNLTAGADAAYTITVHNAGPSDVTGFTVTDTLDDNLTFRPSTGCTAANQVVTCTGNVTSGNDAVITLNVTVESTATPGASIQNTAAVAAPTGVNDPNLTNNSNTATNNVVASADLEITKSHTGNFTAGTNNTFTLAVHNIGPSDATTATVTDVLPAGLTYVSATGAGCANADQTVTCTIAPTISAGQTVNIVVTVLADASTAGGTVKNNTASVASGTPDPNNGNNSDTDAITIDSSADLAIAKTNSTDFTAGNQEDYTIQVTNNGPSNVSSFTVTDNLPAGQLTYAGSHPSDPCAGSSGTAVTCTGGALASGQTATFYITVNVNASLTTGTTVSNTASVATVAPTTDPVSGNNSSTDPTPIVDSTDLAISKNSSGTFTAGENATYTMTVTNNGPSDTPTSDVTVTDVLPDGMTYVSAGSGGTGWGCSGTTTVVCTYAPALAASGTTPTLTVNVSIPSSKQGEVTNTATVSSVTNDPVPGNDSDSVTTTIGAEADLTATKAAQGPLTAGEPVVYRFEVANNTGPSDANNVTITDDLEGHFTYQSFTGDTGWNCSEANGTLTCTLGTLALGATSTVDVTLLVAQDAPNPTDNTAAVTFNGTDPSPANPSDSEPVAYEADLEVKLSHESETYHSGDTVTFTYTVINHGPSAASNVVLTDTLPNGLTFESIVASQDGPSPLDRLANMFLVPMPAGAAPNTPFTCSNSGQNITCNTSTLLVGTYTITMKARIAATFTGNLTSLLQITSSTFDPNPNNNSSSDTILGVQAARGLVGTGQNLFVWLLAAAGAIGLPAAFVLYRWKKFHTARGSGL